MKTKRIILIGGICLAVIAVSIVGILLAVNRGAQFDEPASDSPDEGEVSLIESSVWHSARDKSEHTVESYTLGNTAKRIQDDYSGKLTVNHKIIDGAPVYEMFHNDAKKPPLLIFLHGQLSRKEESLEEMNVYANEGYFCVAMDLQGHGERITDQPIMALEITKNTAADIDTILDYYDANDLADADRFALIGFSQGGSIAYWYAAYGKRTPAAMAVGSTSPDFAYAIDDKCICNGKIVKAVWSDSEIKKFVEQYNPIQHVDKLMTMPIISGNSIDDDIVPYQSSESLEKLLKQGGNRDIRFYYFDNSGHNVTTDFVEKILPLYSTISIEQVKP